MGDLYKMFKSGKLLKQGSGGGGGGGASDYENLENLPTVNGHVIKGAMVSSDLDLPSIEDVESKADASETEQALQGKADKSTTYTKTEVDTALSNKADKSTTYTKTEVDTALGAKANSADVYSKTAVDTALGNKADKSTTYTKTEVDTALGNKADKSTTYTKTEVDTALGGKQAKLTSAQLAAVNSGMTSEDVEQINTNKNNISLLAIRGGGYNFAKIGTNSYTGHGLTLTVANGVITISGTATVSFSLYLSGTISDALTADSKLSSQLPTQIAFTGAPDTDSKNRLIFSLYNDSTWVYSGSTNDLYHDLTGKIYNNWLIYLPIVSGNTYNGTWRPMIVDKTIYDSGFTDFQPYAMSNAEITAWILSQS